MSTTIQTPRLETRVRSMDPETSWQAAHIDAAALSKLKSSILHILTSNGPLTDDEVYDSYRDGVQNRVPGYMPRSATRVRTARHEMTVLTNPPLIRRSAELGKTALGNASQKWEVIPIEERVRHEFDFEPVHPESLHTEKVCKGCGEWDCAIAQASEDVPE